MKTARFSLAFGRNIGSTGLKVAQKDVNAFLRENVTPRFQGFTVKRTKGYWEGKPEDSFTVDILADATNENRNAVRMIAQEYCALHLQDAVLVSETPCAFSFVNARSQERP